MVVEKGPFANQKLGKRKGMFSHNDAQPAAAGGKHNYPKKNAARDESVAEEEDSSSKSYVYKGGLSYMNEDAE